MLDSSPAGVNVSSLRCPPWFVCFPSGSTVDLPPPVYTLAAENDGDESDEDQDGGNDGNNEGGDDANAGQQPKKKKQKSDGSSKGQRSHDGPKPIRVCEFHSNNQWFMYQTDDKYIHLYHMDSTYASGFKHIKTVTIPKKVQAATFHTAFSPSTNQFQPNSESTPLQLPHLIVADKTGDIFVICGNDLETQNLELGHLANVTGVSYFTQQTNGKNKSYLLSSDSDGKIRVSNSPNYFDIQSFCLGHEAFVSSFTVLPSGDSQQSARILSGGLGAELMLWNLIDGQRLQCLDLTTLRPTAASSSTDAGSSSANKGDCYISQVSTIASTTDSHTVFVSVYPWSEAFILTIANASNTLTLSSVVTLPTTPMFTRVSRDRIFLIDSALRFRAFSFTAAELTGDSVLSKCIDNLNSGLAAAQAVAGDYVITPSNADSFIGGSTEAPPKFIQQTEAEKAKAANAAAAGHQGRYISPFSSTHVSHILRLTLLSAAGFAYRRHADKLVREAYISSKKAETAAKRQQQKEEKKKKHEEHQRQQRREDIEMDE